MEIYNEEIRDLLVNDSSLKYDIKMSDSKGTDIHVTNLKVEEVLLVALIRLPVYTKCYR